MPLACHGDGMSRSKRSAKLLAKLFNAQNGLCYYCDGQAWMRQSEDMHAAAIRLCIPNGSHAIKMLRDAEATKEHLLRRADGGTSSARNLKMACQCCNSRRGATPAAAHRIDMQVLVAAGLHPVNRPPVIDSIKEHRKRGLRAMQLLRRGIFKPAKEPTS